MDQIKIGKFIAALRKEKGLTQEQLGEKLGVTNKTISRWENGNYMPDVEMLSLLSKRIRCQHQRTCKRRTACHRGLQKAADDNLVTALDNSTFTLKEKIAFFKKKMAERTYCNDCPARCGVDWYYRMDSAKIARKRCISASGHNRQYACHTFLYGTAQPHDDICGRSRISGNAGQGKRNEKYLTSQQFQKEKIILPFYAGIAESCILCFCHKF